MSAAEYGVGHDGNTLHIQLRSVLVYEDALNLTLRFLSVCRCASSGGCRSSSVGFPAAAVLGGFSVEFVLTRSAQLRDPSAAGRKIVGRPMSISSGPTPFRAPAPRCVRLISCLTASTASEIEVAPSDGPLRSARRHRPPPRVRRERIASSAGPPAGGVSVRPLPLIDGERRGFDRFLSSLEMVFQCKAIQFTSVCIKWRGRSIERQVAFRMRPARVFPRYSCMAIVFGSLHCI